MTEATRVALLEPPVGPISMVLDTDTFNEIDDQFALAYAIRAHEAGELTLKAIHAAPFSNPGIPFDQGMELSYQEILRVLDRTHSPNFRDKAFRGSIRQVRPGEPVVSDAAENLIRLAREQDPSHPLYVVTIGAATNVASALMLAPEIKEKIVVVWLGGNCLHWPHVREFNAMQDIAAGQHLFNCGVPLVLLPAENVVEGLRTSIFELEHYLDGKSEIGTYLVSIVREYSKREYHPDHAWSKVIWDIAGVTWLLHPEWFSTRLVPTPILTDDLHWASDPTRPLMRICDHLRRDPIFMEVFRKLTTKS